MRMYDIIAKKRDGKELSPQEIDFFVKGFCEEEIPDYQVSALLMAICFNGMSSGETAHMTMTMAKSGDTVDLSGIEGVKVDKHSTGGVGDKTTLVVGPLVAAAGIPVAKMSGRSLGHTGGTIDKLESIPGFKTNISRAKMIDSVNRIKIAIAGQTGNLVPADKKIYALRDVTATVESIPLIASSVMSKKIAGGADAIVLDVKTGSGAFMKIVSHAKELAKEMVSIGKNLGRNTVAVVSNMDQPLGNAIGNALEVREAIETLKGKGPKDLEELCVVLGAHMLKLSGRTQEIDTLKEELRALLKNGKAFEKFREMVINQEGNVKFIDDPSLFKEPRLKIPFKAGREGYISRIQTDSIGVASMILGAGRENKDSEIELDVGIIMEKKIGDKVKTGDVIAWMYANHQEKVEAAQKVLEGAFYIDEREPEIKPLIIDVI